MKRRTIAAHAVLVVGSLTVGVIATAGSDLAVGALAVVLAVWILYASLLMWQRDAARADRQLIIDSWTNYRDSGMNALERARKIREHHAAQAAEEKPVEVGGARDSRVFHAMGLPCGVETGFYASGHRINCPICVALTMPDVEVQP